MKKHLAQAIDEGCIGLRVDPQPQVMSEKFEWDTNLEDDGVESKSRRRVEGVQRMEVRKGERELAVVEAGGRVGEKETGEWRSKSRKRRPKAPRDLNLRIQSCCDWADLEACSCSPRCHDI
ncbi:hypothetical protein LWI29_038290 [Acer saccharum]|uniref:Uncharacterized protein n=1 Tax=Acer saccharum TaxID=4024 RepID=A0AA39VHB4_ACESA|nr:hypothetical protein LWI29_038290 [Acer saccharum]